MNSPFEESFLLMLRLFLLVLVLLPVLSSCGLANRFFTTNECEGDDCRAPVLLDNSKVDKKWFCYGSKEGGQWECQNQKDSDKVNRIALKPNPMPIKPEPIAAIPAPEIVSEPAPELPRDRQSGSGIFYSQILELPADHYAVQLIALRNLDGVLEYAGRNGVQTPKVVKTKTDDVDWYVLILDTYPNQEMAQAAKAKWETAKVLRVESWIRKLGPLQEAILAARG
ncbi:MAG: hypothetical protein ACI9HA_002922 [Dinoroseobacter sp.]